MKNIRILGSGGFAKEVYCCLRDWMQANKPELKAEEIAAFVVKDSEWLQDQRVLGVPVIPQSALNAEQDMLLIAVGDSALRAKIVQSLGGEFEFFTLIHPSVVCSPWVSVGEGSIVCAGTILTCDIKIGKHAQLNLHTTVGHDCQIGDYFTTAPGANISGNCTIADRVYIGTGAALKQGVSIVSDVTVGMGAVVTKSLAEAGVYVGAPAKKMGS